MEERYDITVKAADSLILQGSNARTLQRAKRGDSVIFDIKSTTPLSKLMSRFAFENGLNTESLVFMFNGWVIRPDQNAKDLFMKNHDTILVMMKDSRSLCQHNDESGQPSTFVSDLSNMLKSEQFSDVEFIVGDEKLPIQAHRAVLVARCEKFRAMFSGEMRESLEGKVVVPNHKPSTFRAMLEFLYTDQVQITSTLAFDLLIMAEEYLILRLKHLCESFLSKQIDIDNVAMMLLFADRQNATTLKDSCMGFITDNFEEIVSNKSFEDTMRGAPDLLLEIMKNSMLPSAKRARKK